MRSIVNYTLQLEILTASDFYAFMDLDSKITFYYWNETIKRNDTMVTNNDTDVEVFDDGNQWLEGRDGDWIEGNCYSDEWCDPSLNSTTGYMNAEMNWGPKNASNLSQSRN